MAIGHFSYLDLSPEMRRRSAQSARERLQTALANPFVTAEQRDMAHAQMDHLDKWEHGKLAVPAQSPAKAPRAALPAAPAPRPQHHEVGLLEAIPVEDKTS